MNCRGILFAACLSVAQVRADSATPTVSSNVGDRDQAGLELAQRVAQWRRTRIPGRQEF